MDKIDKLLDAANHRLKISNTGITIFRRGQKLSLRGMLPPKIALKKSSQQTIALGIYCNSAGIRSAEKQAQKLSSDLALNQFDWDNWTTKDKSYLSTGYYIEQFEKDYFNRKADTPQSRTTWNGDYWAMLKRLPMDELLSDGVLLDMVLTTEPDSRQRKRAVMVANALASFARLDVNFNRYKGNYSHTRSDHAVPASLIAFCQRIKR